MFLSQGQNITAPFLASPATVKRFEARQGYFLLEVVLHDDHNTYKALKITEEQLSQILIPERNPVALTGNAEDFFFLIEANRICLAYQFDPQLAVSISQVDPLPHQIEAVYHYVLQTPRIRFLIADDPSAGKTIMAGLILKELQYRRLHLVVSDVPASRIGDVNRGILMPFSRAVGDLKFIIEIEVKTEYGISQSTMENQIKETIRQIGAKIDEEEKD
jgi:hypothetical protein